MELSNLFLFVLKDSCFWFLELNRLDQIPSEHSLLRHHLSSLDSQYIIKTTTKGEHTLPILVIRFPSRASFN